MGREEEIAYAREHGIPVKGGTETAPYSIDDNLWGRSSEGRWIEDLDHAPEDDVFQLVTRPEQAPDEPQRVEIELRARRCRSRSTASAWASSTLIERVAEIGARHGVGIVDHIEDRIVGLKVRDIYEVPAAAILLPAHQSSRSSSARSTRTSSSRSSTASGPTSSTPGSGGSRCAATSTPTWSRSTSRSPGRSASSSTRAARASSRARRRTPSTTRRWRRFAESGGLFSQAASPGFIELWTLQSRMAWRLRNER